MLRDATCYPSYSMRITHVIFITHYMDLQDDSFMRMVLPLDCLNTLDWRRLNSPLQWIVMVWFSLHGCTYLVDGVTRCVRVRF
jgi:hypothetical protein